jgi:hypothetical protein
LLKSVKNDNVQVQTTLGIIWDWYLNDFDGTSLPLSCTISTRFASIKPMKNKRNIGAIRINQGQGRSGCGHGRSPYSSSCSTGGNRQHRVKMTILLMNGTNWDELVVTCLSTNIENSSVVVLDEAIEAMVATMQVAAAPAVVAIVSVKVTMSHVPLLLLILTLLILMSMYWMWSRKINRQTLRIYFQRCSHLSAGASFLAPSFIIYDLPKVSSHQWWWCQYLLHSVAVGFASRYMLHEFMSPNCRDCLILANVHWYTVIVVWYNRQRHHLWRLCSNTESWLNS